MLRKKGGELPTTPKEFAEQNWREILAISGTLAGAVILLLIRYHKKRTARAAEQSSVVIQGDPELDGLEEEAQLSQRSEVPLLLDLSRELTRHIPDIEQLTDDLAQGLPETVEESSQPQAEEAKASGHSGKGSLWRRLTRKKGNPRELMQTIGKIK